ncbi:MAG: tetratricopeptide repeat protein [Mariprofundaceae bacterium]|nr:tetratricopeptide repeat protein [Mariprofundaceae bacterium]
MKLFLWMFMLLAVSACSSIAKKQVAVDKKPMKVVQQAKAADFMHHSPRFLYMAARSALQENHHHLAMQFLEALNQKLAHAKGEQKWAVEPRLQLVQLWLKYKKYHQSIALLQPLLAHHPMIKAQQDDHILRLHTLYARVLAAQGQYADASDELTRVLSVVPDFLPARHLQIALFMETKQWALAHIVIQTAFQRHDTAMLRKLDADVFLYEKKYTQALKSLEKMQQLAPDDSDVPLLQSHVAMQQGDENQAKHYLKTFLSSHPDDMRVKNKLAALYIRTGHEKDAIRLYQELAASMPDNAAIASALGVLFYQQQQIKQAKVYFERAYKLQPKGRGHAFYLAASLEYLKQAERARALYQHVPQGDGLWVEAQLRLAGMDFVDKKFDLVQQRMLPLLKDYPERKHAWILLSASYLNQKDYQKLLDTSEEGALLDDPSPRLMLNRAIALEHFKRYKDVETTLKQVIQDHPENTEALNFLGYTYAEQGVQLNKAKSYIQKALQLKPNDGYYLDSLAWVYYQQGHYEQAMKLQRQSLAIIKDDATMQEHLGDILWKLGQHDVAIQQWQLAITLKPEKPKLLQYKIKHGLQ